MPDGSPFEADKPGPEATQTEWQGDRTASPDPVAAIHEDATILGGLDVQRPGSPSTDDRATGVADLAEFRRAVIDIGLIDETELETLASAIPGAEGVLGLARVLQQAGRLTRYQAAALYQRKSRGLLIGNYLILDKLGRGGMGMVFKARHRRLGRVVALKILPPSFARDKTAVQRFKREVEAAGRLKHPNIVAALDADEDRGVHFLVMEYVEGSDLDHVVRHRGQLPLGQAVDFVIQAARGLEAAHSQGIVHRDIKPSNLMLDGAGTVRVLDLGLARIVDASNPFGQAAGRPADPERDVHGDGGLHGARAGGGLAAGRPPRRHLQPGLHPLFPPDRPGAVRGRHDPQAADGAPGTAGADALAAAARRADRRWRRSTRR